MNHRRFFRIWPLPLLLAACAPTPEVHRISAPFDQAQAEHLLQPGSNRILGNASIRTSSGGIATCGGEDAVLIPATQYAVERMHSVFGSEEVLFFPSATRSYDISFQPDNEVFKSLTLRTHCNAQGAFEFTEIASGDFLIGTTVQWAVKGRTNSAAFMRRVRVEDDGLTTVEFSHRMSGEVKLRPIQH